MPRIYIELRPPQDWTKEQGLALAEELASNISSEVGIRVTSYDGRTPTVNILREEK